MFQLITSALIVYAAGMAVVVVYLLIRNRNLCAQLLQKDELIEEQMKARVDILNNINQEIRTPLNAVVGFSEQLGHTPLGKEQRELLKSVERAAGMLLKMVNNVQDLSKIEKAELVLQQQPFSVFQAFSEAMASLRVQASRKQLQFDAIYEGNRQLQVTGDVARLKQILINLTDNAIRYTDHGRVTVKIGVEKLPEGKAVINIIVADTGRGIPADIQPFIFEHFSRRKAPYVAAVNGAGLGLAITKGLLHLHNGTIGVNSIIGAGSTFTCNIPYTAVPAPQTVLITQREVEQMTGHFMEGRYVLVADDQEMNLILIEKILTRWKCRFDKAPDGAVAYELFCANNYDMVLLDLQMPRMSGIEVVKRIRMDKDSLKANIPVLALTADTTLPDNDAFLEVGFDDYLLKPFKERDIYNVIIKHLPYNPQELEWVKR